MEQCLYILLFFIVPLVLSVPRQYYLIQQGKTWSDAQAYCRATHTDLAIIDSNDNMVRLQNEAQRHQFSSSAWIGLYNPTNSWRWSMGNLSVGALLWKTVSKTGNQRYIYISNSMTWLEAQTYCRQHHTDLASSRDATEDSVIKALTSDWTWFGLFRDSWKWTDQTKFSTISWMTGKPDNTLKNENCGYINNGQAADALCSDIMPFFCYSDVTGKQQILRVKVQSDKDVNDPAVMTAILEQINQKLKDDLGTENITVKWRKQSDGVVFHKLKEEKNTTVANNKCDL
ncbi:uncharacterized protein LOC113643934 isoform X2 [Tachysurus fulvidraco]|uniref:uncharacterized protein LOC113643934 isoform X2 n=1 Tax=Tachysurus fulvidraco TaxID=1234273 RepID=UPI001FEE5BD1|nr:uncharacterized protein LOC113643934 isoform X2 [Tachysurus fulvidraco]